MIFSHYIAIRYLKSGQENRFFSWITFLTIAGIAIGVAALIVVISVFNGFEFELRKRFLHANAHIMAYRYPAGMEDPEKWSKIIANDFKNDIKGISPFIHFETMIKSKSTLHGVLIRGINPELREKVQSVAGLIEPASSLQIIQNEFTETLNTPSKLPGVILGSGLKSLINVEIGENVYLVSPGASSSDLREFKVVGIYNSGLKHYDNRLVVMSIKAAQNFFRLGSIVTGLEIGLNNHMDSVRIAEQMESKYQLSFREWQAFNRPLFETLKRERLLISIIVAMVILVAAFNILTTVFVSVSQKQKDISILKSIGATNSQIIKMFINQGTYMGLIGGISGGILALGISWFLENYMSKFLELPDPYFLKTLPVHYSLTVYLTIIGSAVVLSILSGIYPAKVASRIEPSSGFKGNDGFI